jgi:glycosyltransferase involved in cell wall biosynthesis
VPVEPSAHLEPAADGLVSGPGNAFLVLGRSPDPDPVVRLGDSVADLFASGMPPSGDFWGLVELPPGSEGPHTLTVSGTEVDEFEVWPRPNLAPVDSQARIAIAMATYDPPLDLFRAQVASIRSQTVDDWLCVISDDASSDGRLAEMRQAIGDDARFVVSRAPRRRGFYRNFERALEMVPENVPLVALSDQDDVWHPEKLETLSSRIGSAQLVYSDARIVDPSGRLVSPTFWIGRRNNSSNLASLLIANTVTGAASMFRRDLLDDALPLPSAPGPVYHDHWLALVALARGEIRYIDAPLYDYVQHERAFLGHSAANALERARPTHRGLDAWRRLYFDEYCRTQILARVLCLRLGDRIADRKRATLDRYLGAERSPATSAWLLARSLRTVVGRNETLSSERGILRGILWRQLLRPFGRQDWFPATPPVPSDVAPIRSPARR